jgi:hypothetical protein
LIPNNKGCTLIDFKSVLDILATVKTTFQKIKNPTIISIGKNVLGMDRFYLRNILSHQSVLIA